MTVSALSLSLGCTSYGPRAELPGTIVNVWTEDPPASEELIPGLDEVAVFNRVADRLEEYFVLPYDLPVLHLHCGAVNSFYDHNPVRIRMCDELLLHVVAVTRHQPHASEDEVIARVHAIWVYMFLHEVGHAVVDMFDLPVLGSEETSVDYFAALLLIQAGESTMARLAVDYWKANDTGKNDDPSTFADDHELNLQRYYDGLCIVYGSDPEQHVDIIEQGLLPEERAAHCADTYKTLLDNWITALGPNLKRKPTE